MTLCGGWEITKDALNYPVCDLPEAVSSAFSQVTSNLVGAKYEPLMYLSTQVVSGTNHMILCRQTLTDAEGTVKIAKMILNIPANGDPQIVLIDQLF